jgi:hypothetical protein
MSSTGFLGISFKFGRSSIKFIFTLQTYKIKGLIVVITKAVRMTKYPFRKKKLWNCIVYNCVIAIIFSLQIEKYFDISVLCLLKIFLASAYEIVWISTKSCLLWLFAHAYMAMEIGEFTVMTTKFNTAILGRSKELESM